MGNLSIIFKYDLFYHLNYVFILLSKLCIFFVNNSASVRIYGTSKNSAIIFYSSGPNKHKTLNRWWFNASDAGPTLNHHWFNVSYFLRCTLSGSPTVSVWDRQRARHNNYFQEIPEIRKSFRSFSRRRPQWNSSQQTQHVDPVRL